MKSNWKSVEKSSWLHNNKEKVKEILRRNHQNLPMNNGAFGKHEKFITEWINRNVAIVIHWIFCECAGDALKNGLAWVRNRLCTIACDHNSICGQIHFVRIRLNETALIRHISIRNFEPGIQIRKRKRHETRNLRNSIWRMYSIVEVFLKRLFVTHY